MHDFFVNHRTEGTSPRLTQDTCPTRLYRHSPAISPIKAEGNQCGLEKKRVGNIEKALDDRRVHRSSDGCSLLAVSQNFGGG